MRTFREKKGLSLPGMSTKERSQMTNKQKNKNLHPIFEDIFEQLSKITKPSMLEKALDQNQRSTNKVIEKLLINNNDGSKRIN